MAKSKTGDLFLASEVHVMRGKEMHAVKGGVLVSETDLTEKELDSLKGFGVLRVPTYEELQAADARAEAPDTTEVAAEAEETARLEAEQKLERDRLAAEQREKQEKAAADLAAKQEKERAEAAGTSAPATPAKSGGKKSGGKKK